jgi:hypothetical protein
LELALRATIRPDGRALAPTKPESIILRSAGSTCHVLGAEGASVSLASLRAGDFLAVHGVAHGRLVEARQVHAAVAGVWLTDTAAAARP